MYIVLYGKVRYSHIYHVESQGRSRQTRPHVVKGPLEVIDYHSLLTLTLNNSQGDFVQTIFPSALLEHRIP